MATSATAMSSMRSPARRCARRGARSVSARRSRSARVTAKSSSTVPPAYIRATTAPASGSPSASAPAIDSSAMASMPIRPAARSRTIEIARAMSTGTVAAVHSRLATAGSPPMCAAIPPAMPNAAMPASARRTVRSLTGHFIIAPAAMAASCRIRRIERLSEVKAQTIARAKNVRPDLHDAADYLGSGGSCAGGFALVQWPRIRDEHGRDLPWRVAKASRRDVALKGSTASGPPALSGYGKPLAVLPLRAWPRR